jgi:acetyl esterase/lipase
MKFVAGLVLGVVLSVGGSTLLAQNERAMHPRLAAAITALRDARAYLQEAPHDFGGHKAEAIRASDEAIRQLNLALAYRATKDR